MVFALPVMSIALLVRRRWLAIFPLLISFALFSVWFLYYATDWWSHPGQGANVTMRVYADDFRKATDRNAAVLARAAERGFGT